MSIDDLQPHAEAAAALLKALANPDRLMILCHLMADELTVAEIGLRTGLEQPSLSQQLAVLRDEALVQTRRDGRHIHYRVGHPSVLAILQTLDTLFCAPARRPRRR